MTAGTLDDLNAVRLRADTAPLVAVLAEMQKLAEGAPKRAAKFFDRALRAIEAGAEAVIMQVDRGAAAGAGDLVVRAQPSDGLLRLVAAARAGNFQLSAVEEAFGHGRSPEAVTERAAGGVKAARRTSRKRIPIRSRRRP